MVYTAMKMFMEISPQLFDECSHDYTERQNSAEQREKARLDRWDKIVELAKDRKNGVAPPPANPPAAAADAPGQVDDIDTITQDNQTRLNALKLQDETGATKEQRKVREVSQNSVSTAHF